MALVVLIPLQREDQPRDLFDQLTVSGRLVLRIGKKGRIPSGGTLFLPKPRPIVLPPQWGQPIGVT